jgi:hypothetical protein
MQKWVMFVAVCMFSLGLFSVAPTDVSAEPNPALGGYTIVNGSVVIDNTLNKDKKRNWVYVRCNHWAGCYMRCIGKLNACENLAQKATWEQIYSFSDKPKPKTPKKPVKK